MKRTQDKYNETKHYFWILKEKMDSILDEKDWEKILLKILEFRYAFFAFINSHRSTTFVLQAEHKTKLGDKFISWYENAINNLKKDAFSKILKELRNINQKEGNIYPTFEFKGETEDSIIFFEVCFANGGSIVSKRQRIKIPFEIEPLYNLAIDNLEGINYQADDLPIDNLDDINFEDKINIFKEAIKIFADEEKKVFREKNIRLHKLKIEKFNIEYTPEEFIENLKRNCKILQDIVDDGWQKLT